VTVFRLLEHLRWPLLLLASALAMGCGKKPLPKPQASDWAVRQIEGLSLEAPYAFTGNPNPLPGFVNIASYMPEKTPQALEIRIDVLQQPLDIETPTLEQFAKNLFGHGPSSKAPDKNSELIKIRVGDLDGFRNHAISKHQTYVESLVFKKGQYYWLVEVYFADESLKPEAKRVLDSVKLK
jgi:hypothetical protein